MTFIAGASGVGKATMLSGLSEKSQDKNGVFLHFDSIGIPPVQQMEACQTLEKLIR